MIVHLSAEEQEREKKKLVDLNRKLRIVQVMNSVFLIPNNSC